MKKEPSLLRVTWELAPSVTVIIVLNLAVFVVGRVALGHPGLGGFMAGNFLVSTAHLQEGHVWTLLTSAFAHMRIWHFALNMFVLWGFGVALEHVWRRRVFIGFYLIASVAGSASHCLASSFLLGKDDFAALGASGAIAGLLVAFALHFPRKKVLLFWVVPIPAFFGVLALAGLDVWGLVAQSRGGGLPIGHGAHLGGMLAGGLMWLFYLRTRFARDAINMTAEDETELDRILAKLDEHGAYTLTREERAFIDRMQHRI